ncbi:MAG: DUF523 domain-containing protein [Candidatus Omnitrophica bacterium]|nr:DUF523 domain-containing protein [Candidatus Omnitrophota bacterium]
MILVSACLAGVNCAWDGKNKLNKEIKKLVDDKLAIPVCPEVLGGRSIPRTKTEIKGGSGKDVLNGRAKVLDENGLDVTEEFLKGARAALELAKKYSVTKVILKSKSPSCGVDYIYDGSFNRKLVKGNGVTTALLIKEGVQCLST